MKRNLSVAAILLIAFVAPLIAFDKPPSRPTTLDVLFSPKGGCTDRIVAEIAHAERRIRVQAYSFTSAPIAKALLDAKKHGVDIEVILDKSQESEKYSSLTFFANQGIPVLVDDRHAIAHNKVILIDQTTVITGSFNFTKNAEESNAENLLVIKGDADLAAKYAQNYCEHREHSRRYGDAPRADSARAPTKEGEPIVYVTRNGTKYHAAGCEFLHGHGTPMRLSEAAKKCKACGKCRPPAR